MADFCIQKFISDFDVCRVEDVGCGRAYAGSNLGHSAHDSDRCCGPCERTLSRG